MKKILIPLVALAASFAGCSTQPDYDYDFEISELKGGCRTICPRCKPNEICPMVACRQECNGKGGGSEQVGPSKGEVCGSTLCATGDVCCNASCGICTPPDGFCIMLACSEPTTSCTMMAMCVLGFTWSDEKCACVKDPPQAAQCATDADCRLFDDYCTGCDCRALGVNEPAPVCNGPGVRCFAQPCGFGQTAACVNGACTVTSAAVQ